MRLFRLAVTTDDAIVFRRRRGAERRLALTISVGQQSVSEDRLLDRASYVELDLNLVTRLLLVDLL